MDIEELKAKIAASPLLSSLMGGAVGGAALGSVIPGAGTAVGAVGGTLGGAAGHFLNQGIDAAADQTAQAITPYQEGDRASEEGQMSDEDRLRSARLQALKRYSQGQ